MTTLISLTNTLSIPSPTTTTPIGESPSPQEPTIDQAKEAFSSASSEYTIPCEKALGKKEWKKMSCFRRFLAYLTCQDYQDIGRRFMQIYPKTYLAFHKKIELKRKEDQEARQKNAQAVELQAPPLVFIDNIQPINPQLDANVNERLEIIEKKENNQHIHVADSSKDGTDEIPSDVNTSLQLPPGPRNSINNPKSLNDQKNIPNYVTDASHVDSSVILPQAPRNSINNHNDLNEKKTIPEFVIEEGVEKT
jgi:hypothetical protein